MDHVLFLTTDLAVGGAENQLQEIALRLSTRGWRTSIVSLMPPGIPTHQLEAAGIQISDLGMAQGSIDLRAIIRLRRVIARLQPDLVHSHMIHANVLARVTRPVSRIGVLVCTSHSIGQEGRGKEALLRLTDRLADKTTHVSRIGLEGYLARRIVAPHRARWIPNGIDLRRFDGAGSHRQVTRQELGVPEEVFLWLAVGVFRPMKAFNLLVRAFAEVSPDAHLVVAGDGPQRRQIEDTVGELSLQDRVTLLGSRNDVNELMSAADAFVLSSTHGEALPLVLLEAAASMLPVVATDVGGCREIVKDGVNGMLVPPSDPKALAQAMREVRSLPREKRRSMGEEGRAWVMGQFDIERVVAIWEDLYRELLPRAAGHLS